MGSGKSLPFHYNILWLQQNAMGRWDVTLVPSLYCGWGGLISTGAFSFYLLLCDTKVL